MIKIIKMEFCDAFKCLMDKCDDNCCKENWSISVDEETYKKYIDMGLPRIEEKIRTTNPHTIIKKSGECPFITNDGLCSIHKDYGEEFLSNTCKTYPRFVSEYKDLYIENMGLSCPAVSRWLVSLERKCKLIEQIYYESKDEKNKAYVESQEEIIMKMIVDCFYKNDNIVDSIEACYHIFDKKCNLAIESEFRKTYSLLFQNISICYLFERIMLQSKKENPDYISVIERLCFILEQFERKCKEICTDNLDGIDDEQIISALYHIMRIYDHEI